MRSRSHTSPISKGKVGLMHKATPGPLYFLPHVWSSVRHTSRLRWQHALALSPACAPFAAFEQVPPSRDSAMHTFFLQVQQCLTEGLLSQARSRPACQRAVRKLETPLLWVAASPCSSGFPWCGESASATRAAARSIEIWLVGCLLRNRLSPSFVNPSESVRSVGRLVGWLAGAGGAPAGRSVGRFTHLPASFQPIRASGAPAWPIRT